MHELSFPNHLKDRTQSVLEDEIADDRFNWDNQRKEIFLLFHDTSTKNYLKGIDLCYSMIQANREKLSKINPNSIKSLKNMIYNTKEKDNRILYNNAINLMKMYEDYICNILLLINGFLLSKFHIYFYHISIT